jgi:hypothetical protein
VTIILPDAQSHTFHSKCMIDKEETQSIIVDRRAKTGGPTPYAPILSKQNFKIMILFQVLVLWIMRANILYE